MIEFDPSKISIEIVLLKSITQALGGSIQIVDEEKSTSKEVYKRITTPLSVARAFIQKNAKLTKYIKPVYTAVVKYDDRVVALERHPMGSMGELAMEGLDGELKTWIPYSQSNFDSLVLPLLHKSITDWYFDGRYVYSFANQDLDVVVTGAELMTQNGNFRKVNASCIDLQELSSGDKLLPQDRTCVAFHSNSGDYAISPPIWKDLGSVGKSKIGTTDDEDDVVGGSSLSFDDIDEKMAVNLNFALKAGKDIGSTYGYEEVEPLQLPRLMIELHTVNLPNLPKQVKATYDVGLTFTHAMAWLLGLSRHADSLETFLMVRSLMKYLTKKGIYRSNQFKSTNIFADEMTIADVQLKSIDELIENTDFTSDRLLSIMNQAKSRSKRSSDQSDIAIVGGLLNEQ